MKHAAEKKILSVLDSCLGVRHVSYPGPRGSVMLTAVLVALKPRGTVTVRAAASRSQTWSASHGKILTLDEARLFFSDLDPATYVGPKFDASRGPAYGERPAVPPRSPSAC
jgi:hypothetical protein